MARPQLAEHGITDLLPQLALSAAIVLGGVWLILRYRAKVAVLFQARTTRFYWEVVVLAALNLGLAILLEAINWSAVGGEMSSRDRALLWILSVTVGLLINAQALIVVYADTLAAERKKREEEQATERLALESQLEDARKVREFYRVVNEAFLRVVSRKRERLTKAHAQVRVAELQPALQCQALVAACWEIIDGLVNEGCPPDRLHRVRVAYFHVASRQLVPEHSWDGTAGDCVTQLLATDPEVRARFDLDSASGCLAKTTSLTGKTFSVRDCSIAAADPDHPFVFFQPTERDEIRSIVALAVSLPGAVAPFDVITVDTDCKGAFHSSDVVQKRQLEMVLKNLAHRLQLEKALDESLPGPAK